MKKTLTIIASFVLLFLGSFALAGCNFEVNYKETSKKLNEVITYISKSENYQTAKVTIDGESYIYSCQGLPVITCKTSDPESYTEIEKYYDSAYAYSINYIVDSANLLSQKPTVESLTEQQENLYKKLNTEIANFFKEVKDFEHEIGNFNRYYSDISKYGESSKDLYHLNYKKAYRDMIESSYQLINSIDYVADQVYKGVKYKEVDAEGSFKSFEKPINLKIINGYFNFIVDSFDCRIPTTNENSNNQMKKIVEIYQKAKESYITHFKKIIDGTKTGVSLTDDKISLIRTATTKYFEEMELYQESYNKLNFVKFFFEDNCNLDEYVKRDSANNNYYNKIIDYLNYSLPSFTSYLTTNLYN